MHLVTRLAIANALLITAACGSKVPPLEPDGGEPLGGRGGAGAATASGGSASGGSGGASGGGDGNSAGAGGSAVMNAAGAAGGSNASASGCQGSGVIFCDAFDKASSGAEPAGPNWVAQPAWQNDRNRIDSAQSHSPPNSVSVNPTSYGSQLVAALGFPPANNSFFVRVFVRLEKSSKDMGGHVSFIEGAEAVGDEGEELRLGVSHSVVDVNLIPGNKGSGGGEKTQFSNGDVDIPRDTKGVVLDAARWYCLEAHFDGKNHQFHLWIDDKEVAAMNVSDWKQGRANWSPTYKFLKIGGQNFSGQMGRAWYDDVAISASRVGCS